MIDRRPDPEHGAVLVVHNPIDARARTGYILLTLLNELSRSSLRDD